MEDENSQVTFLELKSRALEIAERIPPGPGRRPIAVFLPKSVECVSAFLGVLYSGNFYVPLDVKSPKPRFLAVLGNLGPSLIVTHRHLRERLSDLLVGLEIEILVIDEAAPARSGDPRPPRHMNVMIDTDPAYCIYTSGSTGVPKGVVVSHRSVRDYVDWITDTYALDDEAVIGSQSPFLFDVSVTDIYVCLKKAVKLVLIPEYNFSFPAKLMEYVNEKKISFIIWVPSVLIHVANLRVLEGRSFAHLKWILFAGEVMPNKQLNYWRRWIPHATYANLYGPTEATVIACHYKVDREFEDHESLPIGYPRANCDLMILGVNDRPVTGNDEGELCIRGTSLASGYWNDPEKTGKAFMQNPLNTSYPERIYRTGDIVRYGETGEILYVGRRDSQIKHMGYRIELAEIEIAAQGIESVGNACALYDKGRKEIVLVYESLAGVELSLRNELLKALPKYMVPARTVKVDRLPFNANGKIDRQGLMGEHVR